MPKAWISYDTRQLVVECLTPSKIGFLRLAGDDALPVIDELRDRRADFPLLQAELVRALRNHVGRRRPIVGDAIAGLRGRLGFGGFWLRRRRRALAEKLGNIIVAISERGRSVSIAPLSNIRRI